MRRAIEETTGAPPRVLHAPGPSSSSTRRTGGAPAVSGGLVWRLRTDPGTHRCGNVGMGARTRCGRSPAGHREPARSAHVAATTEQGRQPGLGVPSTWVVRAVLGSLFPAVLLAQGTSPRVEAVHGSQVQSTGPVARGPLTHRDHGRGPDARLRRGREQTDGCRDHLRSRDGRWRRNSRGVPLMRRLGRRTGTWVVNRPVTARGVQRRGPLPTPPFTQPSRHAASPLATEQAR